jgi:hypothetical protein
MNAPNAVQHIPGPVKLAAALILLAGLLLGGILAAPAPAPVQALNAPPQVTAPLNPTSTAVNGTLASFTALIPQFFSSYMPLVSR